MVTVGLGERRGHIDQSKNPDLFDIEDSFRAGVFLVAEREGVIVATGAYLPEANETVRMQRMSVLKAHRGQGFGKRVLAALEEYARRAGFQSAVLETTETWQDAIDFYKSQGYITTGFSDGDIHMVKTLAEDSSERK